MNASGYVKDRHTLSAVVSVFSSLMLLLPFIRYVLFIWRHDIALADVAAFLRLADGSLLAVMIISAASGLLLLVRSVIFWVAGLILAGFLMISELVMFYSDPLPERALSSFLGAMAVVFLTSRDITAVYFAESNRGFRKRVRRPVNIEIYVDGQRLLTENLSEVGAQLKGAFSPSAGRKPVQVTFRLLDIEYNRNADIIWLNEEGMGIRFIAQKLPERRRLKEALHEYQRVLAGVIK